MDKYQVATKQEPDPLDRAILDFLARGSGASTSQNAAHVGRTPRTTREHLNRLMGLGLVAVIGGGPKDPRRRFYSTLRHT